MRGYIFGRKSKKLLYEVEKTNTSLFYIWVYKGKLFEGCNFVTNRDIEKITNDKRYLINWGI